MHPLEHKLDQALSEIGSIKQILRDHSRKLEETESIVKQVEGHHEVHENLAKRTSEKLDIMQKIFAQQTAEKIQAMHENLAQRTTDKLNTIKEQLFERLEQLNLKFQQSPAAAAD